MGELTQRATVVWEGIIAPGSGTLDEASGALVALPLALPTRMGKASGKTTPEELLAGAHAGCTAISLGSVLARAATPPARLEMQAAVTLDTTEGKRQITKIALMGTRHVPDADAVFCAAALADAEQLCLTSRAARGNVTIDVSGVLL